MTSVIIGGLSVRDPVNFIANTRTRGFGSLERERRTFRALSRSRTELCRVRTHVVLLALLSLLQIVLLGLEFNYGHPQVIRFYAKLLDRQTLDFQRLDAYAKGDFLLLLELLLRLATLELRRR